MAAASFKCIFRSIPAHGVFVYCGFRERLYFPKCCLTIPQNGPVIGEEVGPKC